MFNKFNNKNLNVTVECTFCETTVIPWYTLQLAMTGSRQVKRVRMTINR